MAKISLDLTASAASLLDETGLGVEGLKELAAQGKVTQQSLKEDFNAAGKSTKEFNSAIDTTVKALASEGKTVEALILKYGSAQKAQRAMAKELSDMAVSGQRGTREFNELSKAAAHLKDTIDDTRGEIKKLSSDTKVLDQVAEGGRAMAAGFSVAAGASALLGEENADMQKSIQKAQGAMALLLGVQEIATIATTKGGIATGIATAAQGAYATVLGLVSGELGVATVAQRAFSAALAFSPIGAILLAVSAVVLAFKIYSQRQNLAKQEFEDYVAEVEAGEKLIELALARSNQERQNAIALLQAQKASAKEIHQLEQAAIKEQIDGNEKLLAKKIALDKLLRERFTAAESGSEEEKALEKQIDDNNDAMDKLKLLTDNLHDQLTIKNAAFHQKTIDDERAFQQAIFDLKQRAAKEAEIFQSAEQRIKTEERLGLAALGVLRKQIELQNKEQGRAAQLTLTQEEQFRILKDVIFKKAADDRLAIYTQEQKDVDALQVEGRQKELDAADLKFTELRNKFKDNAGVLIQLETIQEKEIAAINTKFNLSNLDANEAHQISLLNQAQRGAQSELAFEKNKAEKKLEIVKQFGEAEIAIIEAQIPNLSAEEKKKAQAQIDAIKEKIAGAQADFTKLSSSTTKFSFSKLLFGDLVDKDGKSINDAADAALKTAFDSILKVASDAVDIQINNNQRIIDSLQKKIEAEESALAKEDSLQKKGLANNVATERRRLDELHKQQKEAIEKQKQLAAEKQAIDAVTQAGSLISAAAQLYGTLGSTPVGVAIATLTIAAMFAAFAAAQVKAAEITNSGFRGGGYTGDGDPSETSMAVGKKTYTYHKKEFVANEQMTADGRDFLEGWHKGDKRRMLSGLADLLSNTGVVLPDENLPAKLFSAKETHDQINRDENNYELKRVNEKLERIENELREWKDRPREEIISHGDSLIKRTGNRTIVTTKR